MTEFDKKLNQEETDLYLNAGTSFSERRRLLATGYRREAERARDNGIDLLQWHVENLESHALTISSFCGVVERPIFSSAELQALDLFFCLAQCAEHINSIWGESSTPQGWGALWQQFFLLLGSVGMDLDPRIDIRDVAHLVALTSSVLLALLSGAAKDVPVQCAEIATRLSFPIDDITSGSNEHISGLLSRNIRAAVEWLGRARLN